jgi:hypothetical protein
MFSSVPQASRPAVANRRRAVQYHRLVPFDPPIPMPSPAERWHISQQAQLRGVPLPDDGRAAAWAAAVTDALRRIVRTAPRDRGAQHLIWTRTHNPWSRRSNRLPSRCPIHELCGSGTFSRTKFDTLTYSLTVTFDRPGWEVWWINDVGVGRRGLFLDVEGTMFTTIDGRSLANSRGDLKEGLSIDERLLIINRHHLQGDAIIAYADALDDA